MSNRKNWLVIYYDGRKGEIDAKVLAGKAQEEVSVVLGSLLSDDDGLQAVVEMDFNQKIKTQPYLHNIRTDGVVSFEDGWKKISELEVYDA